MQRAMLVATTGFVCMLGGCDSTGPHPRSSLPDTVVIVETLLANEQGAPTASLGATLGPGPGVLALDAQSNPVPNVLVRFAVRTGGGSITGTETRTDAYGRARVASWTLGMVAGLQLLDATAGSQVAAVQAVAANPCPADAATPLALNAPISGALETSDCTRGERFADLYRLTTESQVTVRLVTSSATGLALEGGGPFASGQRVILPPGSHSIILASVHSQQKGPYVIEMREESESLDSCSYVFAVPGIATTQTLGATDCDYYGEGNFADPLSIYIKAGQKVTITMSSDVLEPALELWDSDLVFITSGTKAGARSTTIVWTAAYTGEHVLIARNSTPGMGGVYQLAIQ